MSERGIDCSKGDRTKQSFRDECDINKLMARYDKTGIFPVGKEGYRFGDFSSVGDYQSSLNLVNHARDQFDNLSLEIRKRFNYNPALLLEFVSDPKNYKEGVELGIFDKAAPVPVVPPVPVVNEPVPAVPPSPGTGSGS